MPVVPPNFTDGNILYAANVNSALANCVNIMGDLMTGPLFLSRDPQSAVEAATKNYVDFRNIRLVTSGTTVNVASNDSIIIINKTIPGSTIVNLPTTSNNGKIITIKDGKGDANSNTITLLTTTNTIENTNTYTISVNLGFINIVSQTNNWYKI